jgi:hypothetical protein
MDPLPPSFKLTSFMDVSTLQEIQDSFAAVANVRASITDADGTVLTHADPTREFVERQNAIARAEEEIPEAQKQGREYRAPILVQGKKLGTIRMTIGQTAPIDDATAARLAEKHGIEAKAVRSIARTLASDPTSRAAAVQFVTMIANAVARLCFKEFELRQRVNELTTLYDVTMMLSEPRDLQKLLDRTVRAVSDVMDCKAASIRMYDPDRNELVVRAVHNLSQEYLSKGPVWVGRDDANSMAWSSRGFDYVEDMTTDPRVQYPEEAKKEHIVSMLSIGMRYRGRPIGVLRVYTQTKRIFEQIEIDTLKAIAAQAAAAIEHARLIEERLATSRAPTSRTPTSRASSSPATSSTSSSCPTRTSAW